MRLAVFVTMLGGVLGGGSISPTLRVADVIPSRGTGYEFIQVRSISTSSRGELAVLQGTEPFILFFDAKGRFLRAIGKRGSGPGEFRAPRVIGRRADSLWVWDGALARITVFGPTGDLGRTVLLPSADQGTLLNDGRITVHTIRNYSNFVPKKDYLTVRVVDQSRSNLETPMFSADFRYAVFQYERAGASIVGLQPFEDGPLFAPASDGSGFILVHRSVTASRSPVFTVDRIGTKGEILFSSSIGYKPKPITGRHITEAVSFLLDQGPPAKEAGLERRIRAAITIPRQLPPVTFVTVGADGSIWLRREESVSGETTWTVLDAHGVRLFDVALKKDVWPQCGTRTGFWAVQVTEEGAESLVLYSLR
jgi:hypothetical protein